MANEGFPRAALLRPVPDHPLQPGHHPREPLVVHLGLLLEYLRYKG